MIRLRDLSLAFRERVILKGLNWQIGDRDRVGLVGDNGAGKTTLLKLIAGLTEPDGGSVEFVGPPVEIGYLPQDLAELGSGTVLELLRERAGMSALEAAVAEAEHRISECGEGSPDLPRLLAEHERAVAEFTRRGGWDFDPTARKVLRGLGFAPGDADRACGEFSGGWRMRIALAAVLMARPDVLLLDEPTNHLDSESMEWLEGWLRDHRGILIFVSHDRRFLDKMASEIAELARGEVTRYSMGYEAYVVEREASRERRERAYLEQREEIERLQKFVDRFRYKATKATQVQSRLKRLERMDVLEAETASRAASIRFPSASRSGNDVLRAAGLAKSYGPHAVYSGIDVDISRGERVALVGVNGAGKSTLLRALSCSEAQDAGTVKIGHGVRMAFYSQERAQDLNYAHTVWEEACRAGGTMSEADKRGLLGAFLFSGDDIYKPVRVLSGGEKSRLALFKLLLADANFLILDEPTNHLDMRTREIFQDALLDYGGTLLIVSHDRDFLDRLATRILELRDGRLRSFPGDYSSFIERRDAAQAAVAAEQAKPEAPTRRVEPSEQPDQPEQKRDKRAEAESRNMVYRVRKKYAAQIESAEHAIDTAEMRLREIDALLCDPDVLADSGIVQNLMKERASVEADVAAGYERWDELNAAMEAEVRALAEAR